MNTVGLNFLHSDRLIVVQRMLCENIGNIFFLPIYYVVYID